MNCENCKHWIYGYCRLLDCRREKDFLCNAWELSVSYERTAKMTAELEMSLTDKLLESRQSPENYKEWRADVDIRIAQLRDMNDNLTKEKMELQNLVTELESRIKTSRKILLWEEAPHATWKAIDILDGRTESIK